MAAIAVSSVKLYRKMRGKKPPAFAKAAAGGGQSSLTKYFFRVPPVRLTAWQGRRAMLGVREKTGAEPK
jgi:hypothetical protein